MTPKRAYLDNKSHAQARAIDFLLSYEDFLELWLVSGKWEQRGRRRGQFQLCRYGDSGPYSSRNCYIGEVGQNQQDRWNTSGEETAKIVELYLKGTAQKDIGKMFGLSQSAVSRIVNKRRRVNDKFYNS